MYLSIIQWSAYIAIQRRRHFGILKSIHRFALTHTLPLNIFSYNFRKWTMRLAEIPECWSLEFQLDATFADNFCHICRQIMYI